MKERWKIKIAVMLITAGSVFHLHADAAADVDQTRKELYQQGFKTDLIDFDSPASAEMTERVTALGLTNRAPGPGSMPIIGDPDLMTPVGDHSVLVIWKEERLENPPGFAGMAYMFEKGTANDVWPVVRGEVEEDKEGTDRAGRVILSGPIQIHLNLRGAPVLLPHLAALRRLAEKFSNRAVLALHDKDEDTAWTNLLAATRLATAWNMEPIEVSHRVRCMLVQNAFDLTWQALQAGDWPEERLARLQQEWESLDLLKELPDVVAFNGASDIAVCRAERLRPAPTGRSMPNPLKAPARALDELEAKWADEKYRSTGTYVDEKDMLLFYRDRVLETRRALQSHSWAEMRNLPGVTNEILFQTRYTNHHSLATVTRNQRRISLGIIGGGVGLVGHAAEAEARRRLIITAIALERYHGRHKVFPKTLGELSPEFLKAVPMDFMDGKQLRYVPTGDGHYYLYSVGLDCIDDGGKMPPSLDGSAMSVARTSGARPLAQGDLVWPVAATAQEARAYYAVKRGEEEWRTAEVMRQEAEHEAAQEGERQAGLKKLLTDPKYGHVTWPGMGDGTHEPTYHGQPLSKFFGNLAAPKTNGVSLGELLRLKPVTSGFGPGVLAFQLPIQYNLVSNAHAATLSLFVDSDPDGEYPREPEWQGFERATNGDTVLWWNAATEVPGEHALQAVLRVDQGMDKRSLDVKGPVMRYANTNLMQFFPESSLFNDSGANLYARLPESNGTYSIEIKTRKGAHLKTVAGNTTNGVIDAEWDLVDEKGNKYAGNSLESFFTVKLTGSGRSQTLSQGQSKIGTPGD